VLNAKMASATRFAKTKSDSGSGFEQLYRIAEVARMLHISRASVYNLLRGEQVIDLGCRGKKGIKLVSESVLRDIVERKTKTFR
jgi:hypothetical protein